MSKPVKNRPFRCWARILLFIAAGTAAFLVNGKTPFSGEPVGRQRSPGPIRGPSRPQGNDRPAPPEHVRKTMENQHDSV